MAQKLPARELTRKPCASFEDRGPIYLASLYRGTTDRNYLENLGAFGGLIPYTLYELEALPSQRPVGYQSL